MANFILRTIAVSFALCFLNTAASAADVIKAGAQAYSLTIKDLIAEDGFALKGSGAGKDLYLPMPSNWQVNSVHVHLMLMRDKGAVTNATVTALVKDFPISSVNMTNAEGVQTTWDFDVPVKYLDGKTLTIALRRSWNEQGINCNNIVDPGNWISVAGESSINYQFSPLAYQPNLLKFPEPFVNDPSLQRDPVLILLANDFDTQDLESAYYLANALIKRASWRGIDLQGAMIGQASSDAKAKNNVIVIGGATEIIKMLPGLTLPVSLSATKRWMDKDNKELSDATGVVMLVPSPWNAMQALLIVTGNANEGVVKAAQALRSKVFSQHVLFNQYALIDKIIREPIPVIDWQATTLAELGYDDKVIYGGGKNTIKYEIKLPANKIPDGMDVTLHYSTSPLLSGKNSSFISLKVNDFPVTGKRFEGGSDKKETWTFHINGNNLLPGNNQLNFIFNLKFYNNDCTPDDISLAWATIFADSELSVDFAQDIQNVTFGDFGAMRHNISVFLPKGNSVFSQNQLIDLTLAMARNIYQIDQFEIYDNDKDIAELARDSNIIYVGSISESQELSNRRHNFPFNYLNNRLLVKPSLLPYLHVSDEIPAALVEIIPSPFDNEYLFLLITANNTHNYNLAIDAFFNPRKNKFLRGNAALIYPDGTFTSIDANRLEMKVKNKQSISNTRRAAYVGFITFIIVFFGGLLCLIVYRRAKHYFSPTRIDKE